MGRNKGPYELVVGSGDHIAVRGLDDPTFSTRPYISGQHLWTAMYNAKLCQQIERESPFDSAGYRAHQAHATAAIFFAVAYLEASINEFYADAFDAPHGRRLQPVSREGKAAVAGFWTATKTGRNISVLDKHQMALLLCGKEAMNQGTNPFQDANLLIQLRNALVHFRPAWREVGAMEKLDEQLEARFKPNGLIAENDGRAWIPHRAAGAGGAVWACETARSFAKEWCERMGVPVLEPATLPELDADDADR
jgi:hypothetical protein